ncbi:MAG: response regulator [Chloroflexi bacterium]|nr:MAG: response regulator [Chloroflexota bacterium]
MARILVIDDDRMMRELYQEILTRRGHAVILAENGTEGLAKVEENPRSHHRRSDHGGRRWLRIPQASAGRTGPRHDARHCFIGPTGR